MRRNGRSAGHSVTLSAKGPAHVEAKAKETGARAALRTVEATKGAEIVTVRRRNFQRKAPQAKAAKAFNLVQTATSIWSIWVMSFGRSTMVLSMISTSSR